MSAPRESYLSDLLRYLYILQQENMFLGTYINAHTDREQLESIGGYLHGAEVM